MSILSALVIGLVAGGLLGSWLKTVYLTKLPGHSVQLHEQALVKRWQGEPWWVQWKARLTRSPGGAAGRDRVPAVRGAEGLEVRNGPAWLSGMDLIYLVGVYDVSDKRLRITVEPVYAPTHLPLPDPPTLQRFFLQLTVVYRPVDMRKVLSIEDGVDELITARAHNAVRRRSTRTPWDPLDDGSAYAQDVRGALAQELEGRGIEIVDVFCERIGVRPKGYLESVAKGTSARNMGDEGLVLTYLEVLEKLAASDATTIIIPADLNGDPRAALGEALRRSGMDGERS